MYFAGHMGCPGSRQLWGSAGILEAVSGSAQYSVGRKQEEEEEARIPQSPSRAHPQ
jgi:hypothetical protein